MKTLWLVAILVCALFAAAADDSERLPGQERVRALVADAARLLEAGKSAEARENLDEALKLDPKSSVAHYVYGVILEKNADLQRAAGRFCGSSEWRWFSPPCPGIAQTRQGAQLRLHRKIPEARQAMTRVGFRRG